MTPYQRESFIRSELLRTGTRFVELPKNFGLNCFNIHTDPDTGESKFDKKYKLQFTKDGSKAHCWVCKWKGSWNKLAPHYGMRLLGSFEDEGIPTEFIHNDPFAEISDRISELRQPDLVSGNTLPWDEISILNPGMSWRGMTTDFLSKVPCFFWKQKSVSRKTGKTWYTDRILFPFYQNGKLLGYSGRRIDSNEYMRYFNIEWAPVSKVFFPFDYVKNSIGLRTVVLVEGQVDALKLNQSGIPALSILGSANWSEYKRNLLLVSGTKNIILCMDGDAAGRLSRDAIYADTNPYFDNVASIDLPDGLDPGALDASQISWICSQVNSI